jgi:hypothetical protein
MILYAIESLNHIVTKLRDGYEHMINMTIFSFLCSVFSLIIVALLYYIEENALAKVGNAHTLLGFL